jgi:phosphomannomutase
MVSVSGVRGRVGEALTPELIARFAAAFGAWARTRNPGRPIVVGRDSRVSGPMFTRVVHGALQSVGCDVIGIGMVPTPTVQLAVEHHHAAGGLAITASHNPIEWNALKFIGASGLFLSADEGAEMRALLDNDGAAIPRATWDALGDITVDTDAVQRHIDAVLALPVVNVDAIRRRRFRVVLDCCHGAGSVILPALLEALGCDVIGMYMEPDGRFHRPPEPVAENLQELAARVRETSADLGMATAPDVDRLALVSERGEAIGEDYTLAFAVRAVLSQTPGAVVTNLSTSRVVSDAAAAHGTTVQLAPVGEVNVALTMLAVGATIGGEGNGGVILPALHAGRDAPVAAALVLHLMATSGQRVSELVAAAPTYAIVKDKLDRPNAPLTAVYDALRQQHADARCDTQDGVRLDWSDRWVHLRPSGTEPIVRVIAEAPTQAEAQQLVRDVRAQLAALT